MLVDLITSPPVFSIWHLIGPYAYSEYFYRFNQYFSYTYNCKLLTPLIKAFKKRSQGLALVASLKIDEQKKNGTPLSPVYFCVEKDI